MLDSTHLRALPNQLDLFQKISAAVEIFQITDLLLHMDELRDQGVSSLAVEFEQRPELFISLISLVQVEWVNQKAVEVFEAESAEQLSAVEIHPFRLENAHALQAWLIALYTGVEEFQTDCAFQTFAGNRIFLRILTQRIHTVEHQYAICSFTDITDWERAQRDLRILKSRYQSALVGTRLGVWDWDVSLKHIECNSELRDLLGFGSFEFGTDSDFFIGLVHASDREAFRLAVKSFVTQETEKLEIQHRCLRGDGSYCWLLTQGIIAEFDNNGRPLKAVGTICDISGRKREDDLRGIEKRIFEASTSGASTSSIFADVAQGIESVFEDFRCAVIQLDEKRDKIEQIVSVWDDHTVFERSFNLDPEKSCSRISAGCAQFVLVNDVRVDPFYIPISADLVSVGVRSLAAVPIVDSSANTIGTICICSKRVIEDPFANVDGLERVARALATVMEKERHDAHSQLMQVQLQNRQRLQSLGQLAGGIAHDFNNLLLTIMTNAEIAQLQKHKADTIQATTEHIIQAATVAARLCGQMLTYAGKVESEYQPVDLQILLDEIVGLVRSAVSSAIQINIHCEPGLTSVTCDEAAMSQVFLNLLTNATEAVSDDGGTITVNVGKRHLSQLELDRCKIAGTSSPGDFMFVHIADDGCGISDEVYEQIFDPFFSTKSSGRGLGLATVFGIVEQHRAAIQLHSQQGVGTQFTVNLPCDADTSVLEPLMPSVTDCEAVVKRVLVVDDQHLVRQTIRKSLELSTAYRVHTVDSGVAALELLDAGESFDLILLDQQMPEMTGLATYSRIREINDDVEICFMTGFAETSELENIVRIDAGTDLIRKPFSRESLLNAVG